MANREALLDQIRRAYVARGKGALDDLMAEFHGGFNRSLQHILQTSQLGTGRARSFAAFR